LDNIGEHKQDVPEHLYQRKVAELMDSGQSNRGVKNGEKIFHMRGDERWIRRVKVVLTQEIRKRKVLNSIASHSL
jgi:hypothetical protein